MTIAIKNILTAFPECERIADIYIEDDIIVGIDKNPSNFIADRTINGSGYFLIPGLVNAHSHAYMTLFRNCADDLVFEDWLFGKIAPLEDKLTGEDCYWSSLLACSEMLMSGTTSYYDMGMFMDEAAAACVKSGIRGVLSRGLSGAPDSPAEPNPRLEQAIKLLKTWEKYENISFMIGPHAPYSCSEEYLCEAAEIAKQYNLPIHIHLSESYGEVENIRKQYGLTPIALADKCGLLSEKSIAAHCVYLTDDDIHILAERGTSVVTNPISNLKLANGIAPVTKLMNAGINVALGTDGSSSNNALNMFRDLSFLTLIHKGNERNPLAVTAREGFKIATVNGAKALCLDNCGEIRVGAKADLVMIDLDKPNLQPLNDPVAALCYSATGYETDTVIVGGNILVEKGKLVNIDLKEVYAHCGSICKRIGTI